MSTGDTTTRKVRVLGRLRTGSEKKKAGRPRKYFKVPIEAGVSGGGALVGPVISDEGKGVRVPVGIELRSLAKMHCAEAIMRVVQIMRTTDDERAALVAIQMILDRGLGKVKEVVEENDVKPIDVSVLSSDDLSKLRGTLASLVASREREERSKYDDRVISDIHVEGGGPGSVSTGRGLVPVGEDVSVVVGGATGAVEERADPSGAVEVASEPVGGQDGL